MVSKPKRDPSLRQKAIDKSDSFCTVCGWTSKDREKNVLLEVAHVMPFDEFPEYDRLDNLIVLCPNHHTEFDRGLLTIDCDGTIHHAEKTNELNGKRIVGSVDHIKPGFLDWHNKKKYVGKILKLHKS